jgi:hypothetical protein
MQLAPLIVIAGLAILSVIALLLTLSHSVTAGTGIDPRTGKASMLGRESAKWLAYAHAIALAAMAGAWLNLLDDLMSGR